MKGMDSLRDALERHQIAIYFGTAILAGLVGSLPATAAVLFVVVASVSPQIGLSLDAALAVLPLYVAYAGVAPFLGGSISRLIGLDARAGRATAFSAGTRNSLVVLPLAYAVPNAVPLLPAVIVTQTMVELIASLAYMRLIPRLIKEKGKVSTSAE